MIFFLLLFLVMDLQAQECHPTDWQYPQELVGCDRLYKREDSQVSFPNGYNEHVIQGGNGQCERKASCNPVEYVFAGKQECWPQFRQPQRRWGYWSREVSNSKVVIGMVGTCSERHGDESIQIPLFGPQCAQDGNNDIVEVQTQCQIAGAGDGSYNPDVLPPLPLPDPYCTWNALLPGIPCWMY